MKRVALVFSTIPHGSVSDHEGSDALLTASALTEDLGVFFVGGDIFRILRGQQPGTVLTRDYIVTFKLLGLYDIDQCWLYAASLRERGPQRGVNSVVDVTALGPEDLHRELSNFDVILGF